MSTAPQSRRPSEARLTASRIVVGMVSVIVGLGVLAYVDEVHETRSALNDFATEQVMVAHAAASALGTVTYPDDHGHGDAEALAKVTERLRALEQPGSVRVFLERPNGQEIVALDGSPSSSRPLRRLVETARDRSSSDWIRLTHPESAELGLPPRTAIIGYAEAASGASDPWRIMIAATARRERDREERGLWRVALGFVLASATVIVFGSLALRIQRKELGLEQQLALAESLRAQDEKLVRADKLATLGALAMGIAHQVATPLGVIVARSDRLARHVEGDENAKRSVDMISEQAQRIHWIVRSFLRLARGGSPTLEHVDPRAIAGAATELVTHRFEEAKVDLSVSIDDALPKIACDPRLLEQAVVNLLLNACDACEDGGHVTLALAQDEGERMITFTVDDDGAGISEEIAARAVEPFFTTKSTDEGTGLGLAIATEIVAHHGGRLTLGPRPSNGQGTRARIDIPILSEVTS